MKKNISILLLAAYSVLLLWSCNKDLKLDATYSNANGLAFVKIIHASPNFRTLLNGSDSFYIYVNNAKITGNFMTYASVFPVTGSTNGLYAAVPPGPQSIRVTVRGLVYPDSITVITLSKTMDPGGYYSLVITDSILTSSDAKQMWLRDQFTLTDTLHYSIRFVNAVMNDPAPVDVYSFRKGANIFTGIIPGSATTFALQNYSLTSDSFSVRTAGTTTELARFNGAGLSRMRAYTLLYRGTVGGTGTKVRALALINNQ